MPTPQNTMAVGEAVPPKITSSCCKPSRWMKKRHPYFQENYKVNGFVHIVSVAGCSNQHYALIRDKDYRDKKLNGKDM